MYVHTTPEIGVTILNDEHNLVAVIHQNQANGKELAQRFCDAENQLQELAARIRELLLSSSLSRALKTDKDADAYMKARSDARLSLHNFGL
jgi:uncharacterized protein YhaN